MVLPTRKTRIRDCEYTIKLLDGDAALNGFGVLAKYAGGPIGLLLAGGAEESPGAVASALRDLGAALGASDMRELAYQMLEDSKVCAAGGKSMPLIKDGNRELFKAHFTGQIGASTRLIWFALKENYADFFAELPGLGELTKRLQSLVPESSASQTVTTGESPA